MAGEMSDWTEEYWAVRVSRRTGEAVSTLHSSADDAWDFANSINDPSGSEWRAWVVGKIQ